MLFLLVSSPVDNENAKLKFALAIPTGVPIAVVNDVIKIPLVADKTIKDYRNNQKKQYTY